MNYTAEQILFQWLLKVYVWMLIKAYGPICNQSRIGEIRMNYKVKNDNPNVSMTLEIGEVRDAEGEVVDAPALEVNINTTDPGVLGFNPSADGRGGEVSFGTSGVASLQYEVKHNGVVLGSGGDTFTVTTGDPASVSSINASFEGLTPEEEPAPEEPTDLEVPPAEEGEEGNG